MTHIRVAKTVAAIATGRSRLARRILNRNQALDEALVMRIVSKTQCHYAGRRPRRPGERATDMDMVSYLLPLWQRGGVVQPLFYRNRTPAVIHQNEYKVAENRFGELTGLVSHQEHLSFGLQIFDHSIVRVEGRKEKVGTTRTFMLVDYDGSWHSNPAMCLWAETDDEAQFNAHHGLFQSPEFVMKHFVHPHRRESVFGAPYLLLKLLHTRLCDEIRSYQCHKERTGNSVDTVTHGEVRSELVPVFTMGLSGPELVGSYQKAASAEYMARLWKWRQLVQWLMRAAELAFYLYGRQQHYTAPWVRDVHWRVSNDQKASITLHPQLTLCYQLRIVSKAVAA